MVLNMMGALPATHLTTPHGALPPERAVPVVEGFLRNAAVVRVQQVLQDGDVLWTTTRSKTGGAMPPKGKNTGTNTSSMSYSPSRRKRMAARRKREEERWAGKAGDVFIVGVDAPRWGEASEETIRKRDEWADRVGQTDPSPLRKCSACGGYATRKCRHGQSSSEMKDRPGPAL